METEKAYLRAVVYGSVQGVFFRAFVRDEARAVGLKGVVRNLPDYQQVEIEAEGDRRRLEALLQKVKIGPPGARVERVETEWQPYRGKFTRFEIDYG